MAKLILTRDKQLISITNPKTKETIRYDLKKQEMYKYYKRDSEWRAVLTQYDFFRGYSISDLEVEEEKFLGMIKKTITLNPNCTSLSTFIARLSDALVYENYESQGIETECYVSWEGYKRILHKPLEFYDRPTIKFFKTHNIKVTRDTEDAFISHPTIMKNIILILTDLDVDSKVKTDFLNDIQSSYQRRYLNELTDDYKYDLKSLIKYLLEYLQPFENMSPRDGISNLKDYYHMANEIGRNVKKYQKRI